MRKEDCQEFGQEMINMPLPDNNCPIYKSFIFWFDPFVTYLKKKKKRNYNISQK